MPQTGSDKALRKLVAELASTTSEDMAAVLGMLPPRSAAQVRSMLAAYGGVADVFDVEAAPPVLSTAGLSGWLAARVMNPQANAQHEHRMTEGAIEALRQLTLSIPAGLVHASATQSTHPDAMGTRMRTLFGEEEGA
jgi:phytoene/squalene synthetase